MQFSLSEWSNVLKYIFAVISGSSSIEVKDEQSGKEYALSSHNISAASINSLNMAMISALLFMTFIISTLIMWWRFWDKADLRQSHCICCTIIINEHRALYDYSSILCKLVTGGSPLKKKPRDNWFHFILEQLLLDDAVSWV